MATVPTATIIPGPKFKITPKSTQDSNGLFMLGNTDPDNTRTGCYAIHFVMDQFWVGEIGILARSALYEAGVADVPLDGPWPFRAFYFNGNGWDGSVVSAVSGPAPTITGTSHIVVTGYGATIGLGVQCSAGSCTMYYLPLLGQSVV